MGETAGATLTASRLGVAEEVSPRTRPSNGSVACPHAEGNGPKDLSDVVHAPLMGQPVARKQSIAPFCARSLLAGHVRRDKNGIERRFRSRILDDPDGNTNQATPPRPEPEAA